MLCKLACSDLLTCAALLPVDASLMCLLQPSLCRGARLGNAACSSSGIDQMPGPHRAQVPLWLPLQLVQSLIAFICDSGLKMAYVWFVCFGNTSSSELVLCQFYFILDCRFPFAYLSSCARWCFLE